MYSLSRITIMICVVLLLAGCHPVPKDRLLVQADLPRVESPTVSGEQEALLQNGNNSFAFDLYHSINLQKTDNLIYSPYSIWMAFSMIYAGARGETENQMAGVFHFLGQESQHVTLNAIDQLLQAFGTVKETEEEGTPFQLRLANAVWSQQGYSFNQAYLDLLAMQYGAGLRILDFQSSVEVAREAINAWVNEQTDGRIKEIAEPGSISPDTRLVLTNAIIFKAGWAYKFNREATADDLFTLIDGKQVATRQMHVRAPLDIIETEDYQAARLPYAYQNVEMWIILPAERRFTAVQDELDSDLMNAIRQQAGMNDVTLTMPSFDFETELSLDELLVQQSLSDAFCPAGDYSGITEGGGLCIGRAVHKATITVDEEGTEAAAATLIAMPVSTMKEIEITVDRPFIFVIMARDSGLILFLGQVLNPTVH